jgi:hypothetical protein
MKNLGQKLLVLVLLLVVLAIFIAPCISLPRTALRSQQAAAILFYVITATVVLFTLVMLSRVVGEESIQLRRRSSALLCTFLC